MECKLDCGPCPIKKSGDCNMWSLNAYANPGTITSEELAIHTQTGANLHTRIDAKTTAHKLVGSSAGGFGVGVPSAIEMDPALYTTDNLKVVKAQEK